jgi:hypothetical protein
MKARAALVVLLLAGCDSPTGPAPVTRLEVYAVPTIVAECDGTLTAWTLKVEETGARYASACEQEIVVTDLQPYEHYTLDISGYSAAGECWFGKCAVAPLPGLDIAECPHVPAADVCAEGGAP